jgi:hypothetical protein
LQGTWLNIYHLFFLFDIPLVASRRKRGGLLLRGSIIGRLSRRVFFERVSLLVASR